ncbi:MAG TPA: OstA-like protein [Puia sp.]|nr:OstA-like protein [Puia sp.]
MKIRILAFAVCLVCCILSGREAWSQGTIEFRKPGSDSVKVVIIRNANTYHYEQKDSLTKLNTWVGGVIFQEGKTLIYCDSMISNDRENTIESFGRVHINDNDSTDIYSDYMKYQVDKRTILFQKNVKLTDGKGVLTTQELTYDLNAKVGVYSRGGKVVNKETILTSDQGTYYEATKDVYFQKHVVMKDPQYDLFADSLLYNTQTQISTFITETNILFKDSTRRTVRTREGFYDLKNRKASFGKRPIITDGTQRITGDDIQFDDSTGVSTARGHAVYTDTAQGVAMIANLMISDKKNGTFLATQKPLLILKQDKDSIYIVADTFFSGRLSDLAISQRKAFIADSLHKHYVDSLFQRSTDSLARLTADTSHQADISAPDSSGKEGDSTHHITLKDESHKIHRDTLQVPEVPEKYRGTSVDSVRSKPKDSALIKLRDSSRNAGAAIVRDSSRAVHAKDSSARMRDSAKPVVVTPARDSAGLKGHRVSKIDSPLVKLPDSAQLAAAAFARDSASNAAEQAARGGIRGNAIGSDTGSTAAVTDTSLRYIRGYSHVRIWSDSLQAVADSMYYSGKDSIFRLYKDPVAWGSGQYQVTGDTMFVYTKNKKADRLYVFENALAINKVGKNFYNQIKGTTINAYFKDGVMDFMRAKGNAESIYYVKDEHKAYTGVNKAHADIIDMIFVNKELNRVVFRSDVEGGMVPFKKVNFDDMRLRGFKWLEDRRPKSKFELLEKPTVDHPGSPQHTDPGDPQAPPLQAPPF